MKCHGVAIVCRIQLDADPATHECAQAGKCIFTPHQDDGIAAPVQPVPEPAAMSKTEQPGEGASAADQPKGGA